MLSADITGYAEDGTVVIQLSGVRFRKLDPVLSLTAAGQPLSTALYELGWLPQLPLQTVQDLSNIAAQHAGALAKEAGLEDYDPFVRRLEEVCIDFVRNTFGSLGWKPSVGESFDAAALANQLHILPRHHRLFNRMLEILAEAGDMQRTVEGWLVKSRT